MLIACMMEQMVRVVFGSHFYEWDGKIFQQRKGGPTGLRSVGPVSRCCMDEWADGVMALSEKTLTLKEINPVMFGGMDVKLLEKYVDDCFAALNKLSPGIRWCETQKAMLWDPQKDKEDRESSDQDMEEQTMREFAKMASGIVSCLRFTWEIPRGGEGMPVLDTKCWMGQEQREDGINPDIIPNNMKNLI